MGADDGASDDVDEVAAYADKIQQYFSSHGWNLDQSRIAQTQYLLGGTTETDDGTTKRGVVIVAAGEGETLNQSHLAKVQRAVEKYEAEEAFVHARGGVSEEHVRFCKENDIRLVQPDGMGSSRSRHRQRQRTQQSEQQSIASTQSDSGDGLSIDTDRVSSLVSRRNALVALVGGAGVGVGGLALLTRGGGDGGEERSVPGASFEITEYNVIEGATADGGDVAQITVQHSGEPITDDNTHNIRLVPEGGEPFDTWPPPNGGAIDGSSKQFEDLSGTIGAGQTIAFVWISPDTERQSTLDTATIPEAGE